MSINIDILVFVFYKATQNTKLAFNQAMSKF